MRSTAPRMGLIFLFAAVLFAAHIGPAAAKLPTVPNVVGMKLDQATADLQKKGFKVKAVAKETWFPGEHQKVYRQTPRPGPLNRGGKTVTIWYFWDRTITPGEQTAKKQDRPEPLRPPVVKAEPPRIRQPEEPKTEDPKKDAAQKEAPKEKPASKEEVSTPSVLGMDLRIAQGILERKGLRLKVLNRMTTSNRFLADTIASQTPTAGLTIMQGEEVTVTVYNYLPGKPTGVPGD